MMDRHEHVTDNLAVDLSLGLLSADEEAAILDHAQGCIPCSELLRQQLGDAARLARRPRAKVVAFPHKRVWGALSLAAAAVLALLVFPGESSDDWLPVPPPLVTRDSDSTATAQLMEALEAYTARDLDRAIHRLETLDPPRDLRLVRDCYLGNALYQEGRLEEAKRVLEPVVESGALPQPWRSRTEDLLSRIQVELP